MVWTAKKLMLVMKPKPREVSSTWNTQLRMVLSTTGMIWKESGIMHSSTNWELHQKSIHHYSLKHQWILRPTEKRWPASCSRHSMSHHSMLVSKPSSHSMLQEEQQVLLSILEMVLHTQSQFMKDMHSHTLFSELT